MGRIEYDPPGAPSLFDRWEAGADAGLPAPLSVRDAAYRALVVELLAPAWRPGATLIGVGAGNGFSEAELVRQGWQVLAADPSASARAHCRAKGLRAMHFVLGETPPPGRFDAIYCDGVLGHLSSGGDGAGEVWRALAALGAPDALCLVSNDLADDDSGPQFAVRSDPDARFWRPPAGVHGADAVATGLWAHEATRVYRYERTGVTRRRELTVLRLLVDEGVEAQDRAQLGRRHSAASPKPGQ